MHAESARRMLAAGLVGRSRRTSRATYYLRRVVDEFVAAHRDAGPLPGRDRNMVLVRAGHGRVRFGMQPEELLDRLGDGWRMSFRWRLLLEAVIERGERPGFLVTVGGFVVLGADVVGVSWARGTAGTCPPDRVALRCGCGRRIDRGGLAWTYEPAPPPTRHPGGAGRPAAARRPRLAPVTTETGPSPGADRLRDLLRDADHLVRAVASGRRKGQPLPEVAGRPVRRVELRVVDLKAGAHLQVTSYDEAQARTTNHALGAEADEAVDTLLAQPFGNWHVDTTTHIHQARVTKKGDVLLHGKAREEAVEAVRGHDRDKERLLREDDPVLVALGISDGQGRIKPSRRGKYRQVEEFLRLLDASLGEALVKGHVRTPTADDPLRVVDLGCGNAYLTFAAHRFLTAPSEEGGLGLPVRVTGVDVKQQSTDHNSALAGRLGIDADFVVGTIADAPAGLAPDVVLALHACDTATDDALARAVAWDAPLVLAAPCCHHDIAAQLRTSPPPAPYAVLTRDGILRERFADTLTDALRAALLRAAGYRVDVVEFVERSETPRNTMLRATRTGVAAPRGEYDHLVTAWGVRPRLGELLDGTSAG